MPLPRKILTLFGTRPEIIKLAPIILEFEADRTYARPLT
jgi:UDP-N-acetylglucosamine 2-epimerase